MAIFNSIVIGSGKGKIGNVVLTKLKGQNVVKSRNYSPANPKTPAQESSRNRMKNAVLAWKFLGGFLMFWLGVAKPKESTYNAFVSAAKNLFSDVVSTMPAMAVSSLGGQSLLGSAPFGVSSVAHYPDSTTVVLSTNGILKPVDLHVRIMVYERGTGTNAIVDSAVTLADWAAGELTIPLDMKYYSDSVIYLYSSAERIASSVLFVEV